MYLGLSNSEEKNKKHQYDHEWYRNLSEEQKTKNVSMVMSDIKILQKIKTEVSWV